MSLKDASGLFIQLQSCLKIQEELIDRLILTAEMQLEALKRNDLKTLKKTVQEQEAHAFEMEKTEQQRLIVQSSLEKALNIDQGVTLDNLLHFASVTLRDSLQETLAIMRKKVNILKEINLLNSTLIKKIMSINGKIMQILNSGMQTTYGLKGELGSNLQHTSVLNKSV